MNDSENLKTFTCPDCDWQWQQGQSGAHDCRPGLIRRIHAAEAERDKARAQYELYKAALEITEKERDSLRSELATNNEHIVHLTQDADQYLADAKQALEDLAAAKADIEAYRDGIYHSMLLTYEQSQCFTAQDTNAFLNEGANRLRNSLATTKRELKQEKSAFNLAIENQRILRGKLETAKGEVEALRLCVADVSTLANKEIALEDCRADRDALQAKLDETLIDRDTWRGRFFVEEQTKEDIREPVATRPEGSGARGGESARNGA